MKQHNFDAFDIFYFVLFLIAIAIVLILTWRHFPAFNATMFVSDKHWQREVKLQQKIFCRESDTSCYWNTLKKEHLEGDRFTPPRWPVLHQEKEIITPPLSWLKSVSLGSEKRIVKEATYFIDFFDRDRNKTYFYKTDNLWEYKALKINDERSVVVNHFGEIEKIRSDS